MCCAFAMPASDGTPAAGSGRIAGVAKIAVGGPQATGKTTVLRVLKQLRPDFEVIFFGEQLPDDFAGLAQHEQERHRARVTSDISAQLGRDLAVTLVDLHYLDLRESEPRLQAPEFLGRFDLLVFLTAAPEVLLARRLADTKRSDRPSTLAALTRDVEAHLAYYEELAATGHAAILIDCHQPPDAVARDVLRSIDSSAGMPARLFQLDALAPVQAVIQNLEGTCLGSTWPRLTGDRRNHFASNATLFSDGSAPRDVWAEAGLGATVNASVVESGEPFALIDLCSMTANTILGINDPWVKLKQAAYLMSSRPHYVHGRFGFGLYYRVARRLLSCFNEPGETRDHVINLRQCNGSDAVELALHAAWKAAEPSAGRRKLATFRGSYHGESLTAHWVSEHQPGGLIGDRPSNVVFFPTPREEDAGVLAEDALATLSALEHHSDEYFAVIVEPIQWRNSVHVIPFDFLRRLREICTHNGICLIFDEMQNAFGYTGTIGFARNCGVSPDISAMSKALTSGHGSLAITVAKPRFREIEGPFGAKSNSGNMLPLVAVDAVLDRLLGVATAEADALPAWLPDSFASELRVGLLAEAYPRVVASVDAMLAELARRFPTLVGAPRGIGLVRGLVMLEADGSPSARLAAFAAKVCLVRGVYVRQADTAILMKPALVLTNAEADAALNALTETFDEVLRIRDGG